MVGERDRERQADIAEADDARLSGCAEACMRASVQEVDAEGKARPRLSRPGASRAAAPQGKKIAARRPLSFAIASTRSRAGRTVAMPPVAARMPRMIATTAITGMMKPPRSSLASSLVAAPLRAATESGGGRICAKTGVLAMETASIAATDAFLKLILNSLLSCSTWQCHSGTVLTTPKLVRFRALSGVLPDCKTLPSRELKEPLNADLDLMPGRRVTSRPRRRSRA